MTKTIQKCYLLMIGLMAVVTLASCDSEELHAMMEQHAIAFASEEANEQSVMLKGTTPLNNNFTVWGYKTVTDATQLVFNNYNVTYSAGTANTTESNTHGYEYVGGSQTIKYWDFGASEYRFWGATGGTFSAGGTTLTISDLALSTTEPTSSPLYSELYRRAPISSEVVQLRFKRPYAKVRVMFFTNEPPSGGDEIQLTDISFGGGAGSITRTGSMTISYPTSGTASETYNVTPGSTQASLAFENITLNTNTHNASNRAAPAIPTGGTEWYYTLPVSSAPVAFTLSLIIDGDPKTAVVPASYMQWNPNTCYTYIFKITEAGRKIEIYDVKIDPWKYGGSQEEEWKNW